MEDAGFILTCYALTFGAIAAYAAWVIRRGKRTTSQLPDEVKPWLYKLDLTPRPPPPQAAVRKRRNWAAIGVLVAVIAAGGLIVTKFLGSAIDYYCNADEIGVRDGCEAGRRLRVQGTVADGTVETAGGITTFTIVFGDAAIPVRYEGEPGGIFAECEPVVVHGRLVDGVFEGDQIEVKHSNEYEAANPERLEADRSCSL